jgi:hypothetical protein
MLYITVTISSDRIIRMKKMIIKEIRGQFLLRNKQNVVWENAHSFNLAALKPAPKKMEFISNIVNVKLTSS